MAMMLFGLAIFVGIHVLTTFRGLRAQLVGQVGEGAYRGYFSVLALAGVLLTAYGYGLWRASGPALVWDPPVGMRHLVLLLMVFACIAWVAALVPSHIKAWLKHPLLVGLKIWAFSHLLANGDAASIVLFAVVLAFAVYDRIALKRRGAPLPVAPAGWGGDAVVVIGALALYAALAFLFHPYVVGVPVIG